MKLGIIGFLNTENTSPVNGCIQMYSSINPYNFTNDVTLNVTPDFLRKAKSLVNKAFSKEIYKK